MECSRRRRRCPPRRGASTQQAIWARAQTPPPPWAPLPRPPRRRRRRPSCRDPASPSSSGTAAAARKVNVTLDQNSPGKKKRVQIRGTRYLLPSGSEEIGAIFVAAAAAAPVIHAEISSPTSPRAAVTRGGEASTNPARGDLLGRGPADCPNRSGLAPTSKIWEAGGNRALGFGGIWEGRGGGRKGREELTGGIRVPRYRGFGPAAPAPAPAPAPGRVGGRGPGRCRFETPEHGRNATAFASPSRKLRVPTRRLLFTCSVPRAKTAASGIRPCLVSKNQKIFKIPRHIKSCDTCIKH